MKILKEIFNESKNGTVSIAGKFNSFDDLSYYLNSVANELEDKISYDSNYIREKIHHLKKPFFKNLLKDINEGIYDDVISEDDLEKYYYLNETISDNNLREVSKKEYKYLANLVSDHFVDKLYTVISNEFKKIDNDLINRYEMNINKDQFYASLDIVYNNMFSKEGGLFFERYGLPINLDSSDSMSEFYLLQNGDRLVQNTNGTFIFKNKTNEGLVDLIENGSDITYKTRNKDTKKKKYLMGNDYSYR
ncbi:MAG: hypothetical protein ACOCRX_01100 [Candidatus Woesearchaeota archaeon]